jgi:hypothetical protein
MAQGNDQQRGIVAQLFGVAGPIVACGVAGTSEAR